MKRRIYALIDCNNFYVSCERVFNPRLADIPVMVLSNNDGCIVSRSNEVKALGVKMAAPAFKYKDLIRQHNIKVFSSNYTLYADMSQRVMQTLRRFTPDMEIYSIDEAFLSLSFLPIEDYESYGRKIRDTVLRWTGVPISVGIASTKVLTKGANEIAKKVAHVKGVVDFTKLSGRQIDRYLHMIDAVDVWGIGRQSAKKLRSIGINTAKDLKYSDTKWVRKKTNVLGERIILELKGIPCFSLDQCPPHQKSILSSRSFGTFVERRKDLKEAISMYMSIASGKLRSQNAQANVVIVFVMTNRFKRDERQYFNSAHMRLPYPTSSTIELTKYAHRALEKIFKKGYKYKKAGVVLEGIQSASGRQLDFFTLKSEKVKRENSLMKFVDRINSRWGRESLYLASEGVRKKWSMRRANLSPCYTTRWSDLLEVEVTAL